MNIVRFSVVAVALLCTTAAGAPGAEGPETSAGAGVTAGDEALFRQAHHAELTYRHRLARLRRLRHLAQEDGSAERLAELDELYQRLRAAHEAKIERLRGRLDAAAHARLDAQLNEGRDRFEWRQEKRQQRHEERQAARDATSESRREARQQRADHRQEVAQEHADQRQTARAQQVEDRQAQRQERLEQRQAARSGAEAEWRAARARAAA
ncbi:MAG: hypothetical protein ACYTE6_07270, partial [Planctomycetota bacterium]